MTSEVAILNKIGVALAADSAATITTNDGPKTYNSANKLFSLSKFHPVGVMIWGSSEINTIPWEIIIKQYREQLGRKSFKSTKEYLNDLLAFLQNEVPIGRGEEERNVAALASEIIHNLKTLIEEQSFKCIVDRGHTPTKSEASRMIRGIIRDQKTKVNEWTMIKSLISIDHADFIGLYQSVIINISKMILSNYASIIDEQLNNDIVYICAKEILSDRFSDMRSGLVVAGYGDNDYFPSLTSVITDGFLNGKCKIDDYKDAYITDSVTAHIAPFAQRDVIDAFITGMDAKHRSRISSFVSNLADELPRIVLDQVDFRGDTRARQRIEARVEKEVSGMLDEFKIDLHKFTQEEFIEKIMDALAFLGKDELAGFAENLVNLTALKRKVSLNAETVGGPIDVAVISRNDGFIWIKRKHYFASAFNPFFFRKYLNSNINCDMINQLNPEGQDAEGN